jgi:hypothetical protein
MPATRAKAQGAVDSFPFNTADYIKFPSVTLSDTTQNNTVVTGRIYLPTSVKIYRVVAGISGSVVGTCSLNIILGPGAKVATTDLIVPIPDTDYAGQPISPGTVAYPPAYAVAGQALLLADTALTMTADTATLITPADSAATGAYATGTPGSAWDSLWGPGGAELTLRLPCSAATGLVEVGILVKYYDPTGDSSKPILTAFNPAVDIP